MILDICFYVPKIINWAQVDELIFTCFCCGWCDWKKLIECVCVCVTLHKRSYFGSTNIRFSCSLMIKIVLFPRVERDNFHIELIKQYQIPFDSMCSNEIFFFFLKKKEQFVCLCLLSMAYMFIHFPIVKKISLPKNIKRLNFDWSIVFFFSLFKLCVFFFSGCCSCFGWFFAVSVWFPCLIHCIRADYVFHIKVVSNLLGWIEHVFVEVVVARCRRIFIFQIFKRSPKFVKVIYWLDLHKHNNRKSFYFTTFYFFACHHHQS